MNIARDATRDTEMKCFNRATGQHTVPGTVTLIVVIFIFIGILRVTWKMASIVVEPRSSTIMLITLRARLVYERRH